jgi:hypothetical protein
MYWDEDRNVPVNQQDSHKATETNGIDSAPIVMVAASTVSEFWEENGC